MTKVQHARQEAVQEEMGVPSPTYVASRGVASLITAFGFQDGPVGPVEFEEFLWQLAEAEAQAEEAEHADE